MRVRALLQWYSVGSSHLGLSYRNCRRQPTQNSIEAIPAKNTASGCKHGQQETNKICRSRVRFSVCKIDDLILQNRLDDR